MTVLAIALFGSMARGDANADSDIDLLVVTADRVVRHESRQNLSISFYSIENLRDRARAGDLFLWHILHEGRALFDTGNCLDELRTSFQFKTSYSQEVGHGADLGWLIVRFAGALSRAPITARRIAWSVRSILIARSAATGRPVFSTAELAAIAPIPETRRLIGLKTAAALIPGAIDDLKRFLDYFGLVDPLPTARSPEDFKPRFEATANSVALHFLRSVKRSMTSELYC